MSSKSFIFETETPLKFFFSILTTGEEKELEVTSNFVFSYKTMVYNYNARSSRVVS